MGSKGRQDRANASTVELLLLLQHKPHTPTTKFAMISALVMTELNGKKSYPDIAAKACHYQDSSEQEDGSPFAINNIDSYGEKHCVGTDGTVKRVRRGRAGNTNSL